jgi:TonB family protein
MVVLAFLSWSVCAWAQSTQQGLEADLLNKPLYLRGLWKKDKLHFSANGTLNEKADLTSPLLSVFETQKVELKADRLELTGRRLASIHGGNKPELVDLKETVHIDISHPDSGDYQPALLAIFTTRLSDLAPAAPEIWGSFLDVTRPSPKGETARSVDQAAAGSPVTGASDRALRVGGAIKPPIVKYAPEPELSDEARRFPKLNAQVLVYLEVGTDGLPTHVRILKPYGLGLDEEAAAAVAKYRFKPAMEGDKPVRIEMNVEVNFQKF